MSRQLTLSAAPNGGVPLLLPPSALPGQPCYCADSQGRPLRQLPLEHPEGGMGLLVRLPDTSVDTSGDTKCVLRLLPGTPELMPVWGDDLLVWGAHDFSGLELTGPFTVEAIIEDMAPRTEAMQVLVAQWELRPEPEAAAYDAGLTGELDTTGFFGAVSDGRYLYFAPQHNRSGRHGTVLRYDTHRTFDEPAAWEAWNASETNGLSTRGFYGAVFDGQYVYFVPRRDSAGFHSRVLRYDTRGVFTSAAAWTAYDYGLECSYQGAAFDGRYIYFCPGHQARLRTEDEVQASASPAVTGMDPRYYLAGHGNVLRLDTRGEFHDAGSWTHYDASSCGGLDCVDYDGAVFDGRYIYFVPLSTGAVLRYDTQEDFQDAAAWASFDAGALGLKLAVGAVFDGSRVYFVPYGETPAALRLTVDQPFTEQSSWQVYDISRTPELPTTGYDGAFFDGRYITYIPYYDNDRFFHGWTLRYDTLAAFDDPAAWQVFDHNMVAGLKTVGFNGGATDGRYLYCAPWQDGETFPASITGHGRVLRLDTLRPGSRFVLLAGSCGHNGGLNASIPGPAFLLAGQEGVRMAAAFRPLEAGRHHVAGVYDGERIHLYVDGTCVAEQDARDLVPGGTWVPFTVGALAEKGAPYRGRVLQVRLSRVARSAAWLHSAAALLQSGSGQ